MHRAFNAVIATFLAFLIIASPAFATNTYNQSSGAGGVPGIVGTSGNDETVAFMYRMRRFLAVSDQLTTTVYVDPLYGSDLTGDGSYEKPYFSFSKIKTSCLMIPHSKCVAKGRNPIFSHTVLTLAYTGGRRPLFVGETVTFSSPTGAAEVLKVEGNYAVVTWLSGSDPRVGNNATTFNAGSGESTGNVTLVRDSINGFKSRVISEANIDEVTTEAITSPGHDYVNGDGPFLWYNETTLPVTSPAMTEALTQVYICSVSGDTFRIGTSSACSTLYTFTDDGTGSNQIIAGLDQNGLRASINVGCQDNTRLCVLFTSEFADSPWVLDSGSLAGDGAFYVETNTQRWTSLGGYLTPFGGIFIALDSTSPDPTAAGWVGVENGVIQNLSDDCFYTGNGGKIVTVGVRCEIQNGVGDRSQNGGTPNTTAHSSVASSSGVSTPNPTGPGAALIMINASGSQSQMGSTQGSGGFLNPNNNGVLRLISDGFFRYDGIPGDTSCSGSAPCSSPFIVAQGGETVLIGPHVRIGGTTETSRAVAMDGPDADLRIYKTVFEANGVKSGATSTTDPSFFSFAAGSQGLTKTLDVKNVSFLARGPQTLVTFCPLQGTSAATANSRIDFRLENVILEWTSSAASNFRLTASDCGVGGYTDADAVARVTFKARGIFDPQDDAVCSGGPCYFYDISTRAIGSCGSANTFLNDVCAATDSAGNNTPDDAWEWFTVSSANSGGAGADGLQWLASDPQLRCAAGNECVGDTYAASPSYTVDLREQFSGSSMGCIPKDVLGVELCSLRMSNIHVGGR